MVIIVPSACLRLCVRSCKGARAYPHKHCSCGRACTQTRRPATITIVEAATALNRDELRRYVGRVSDRWPINVAMLGGARVDDERGALTQRERGPEYVVVLVSEAYEGIPWLERVYVAGSLWDAYEMGDKAEVHCYTPAEFARKTQTMSVVRHTAFHGIDLFAL